MFQISGKIIQRTNEKKMLSQGFCQGQGLRLLSALFSGFIILKVSVYFLVATVQRKCSTIVKKFGHKTGVYLNVVIQFISVTVL